MTGYVYLIHFDRPLTPGRPCQHYLGYTESLAARIQTHAVGGAHSARLMQVVAERGIGWHVVRVWRGGRDFERQLKNRKGGTRLCPVCNPSSRGVGGHAHLTADEVSAQLLPF